MTPPALPLPGVAAADAAYRRAGADVAAGLGTDPQAGLDAAAVLGARAAHGRNRLASASAPAAWRQLAAQFRSTLVLLLLAAAAISAGLWLLDRETPLPFEGIAILAVVLLNGIMGCWQQARAEQAVADPYNVDQPEATRFAQEARIVAQAAGHKPGPRGTVYVAPQVFQCEPHQPGQSGFKPNRILNLTGVWDTRWRAFEQLPARKHLRERCHRVAPNRGMQGGRNSGRAMTHGEAYQTIFPDAVKLLG